ncbi:MAG TPA: nuclear transport factor 2 family protein [Sphingopyxis sp.]|nr:nuclear transport factor 2 family protein [Sphingopyxis sp.]
MIDEIVERLKKLEAAEAARHAISNYCLALDVGDLDLLRSTFTADVQVRGQYSGELSGIDNVLSYFAQAVSQPVAHRKHYTSNIVIDSVEDNVVSASCYFLSYHGETEGLHLAWGRYKYETRLLSTGGAICDLSILLDQPVAGLDAFRPQP